MEMSNSFILALILFWSISQSVFLFNLFNQERNPLKFWFIRFTTTSYVSRMFSINQHLNERDFFFFYLQQSMNVRRILWLQFGPAGIKAKAYNMILWKYFLKSEK